MVLNPSFVLTIKAKVISNVRIVLISNVQIELNSICSKECDTHPTENS